MVSCALCLLNSLLSGACAANARSTSLDSFAEPASEACWIGVVDLGKEGGWDEAIGGGGVFVGGAGGLEGAEDGGRGVRQTAVGHGVGFFGGGLRGL